MLLQWESRHRMSLCTDFKTRNTRNTQEPTARVQPLKTELRELQFSMSCWYFNPPNTRQGIRALLWSTSDAAVLYPKLRVPQQGLRSPWQSCSRGKEQVKVQRAPDGFTTKLLLK